MFNTGDGLDLMVVEVSQKVVLNQFQIWEFTCRRVIYNTYVLPSVPRGIQLGQVTRLGCRCTQSQVISIVIMVSQFRLYIFSAKALAFLFFSIIHLHLSHLFFVLLISNHTLFICSLQNLIMEKVDNYNPSFSYQNVCEILKGYATYFRLEMICLLYFNEKYIILLNSNILFGILYF